MYLHSFESNKSSILWSMCEIFFFHMLLSFFFIVSLIYCDVKLLQMQTENQKTDFQFLKSICLI